MSKALQWVTEFYDFLQGEVPESISLAKGHVPKMGHKKAMSIIWYLQEHVQIIPNTIECCDNCKNLFDMNESGLYWESKNKFFCQSCSHLVPRNYDRGKR